MMMIDRQEVFQDRLRKLKRIIKKSQQKQLEQILQKSKDQQQHQRNQIIHGNQQKQDINYLKKFKGIQVQLKIMKSRKINDMRMNKMKVRFQMIQKIQHDVKQGLLKQISNKKQYLILIKKLIIQSMIKMLEEKIQVRCLKRDLEIVRQAVVECEEEFKKMCTIETKLNINEHHSLSQNDLGGIVLTSYVGRIVCDNTLRARVDYALQLSLPEIRFMLFGAN